MNKFRILLPILGLILLVGPTLYETWLYYAPTYFYEGYTPRLLEFDEAHVQAEPLAYNQEFVDDPIMGEGKIIIDLTHNNNLELNDIGPLKSRLEARGVNVILVDDTATEEYSLKNSLRGATGMIVLAPTYPYDSSDQQTIIDFVDDGGRLLLVADPTRAVPPEDTDFMSLSDIFFPQSAVPAINSLANSFNIRYVDDYLYNLEENEGNYRNVRLTNFAEKQPLTSKLETVVMFAGYSLYGDGVAIMHGDENTKSPIRTGEPNLISAMLTHDEQVLALGDLTMLIPPYNSVADNNQFLSNIATWLAVDNRERQLEDFPYLFDAPMVSLVQTNQELLDPRLIAKTGQLRPLFQEAGSDITLSAPNQTGENDLLFVGTFEDTDIISDYLRMAGITITVNLTETTTPTKTTKSAAKESTEEVEPLADLTLLTDTLALTATDELTALDDLLSDLESDIFVDDFADETESDVGMVTSSKHITIEVESMGTVAAAGTTIYFIQHIEEQVVVVALAENGDSTVFALDQLIAGDYANCVQNDILILCSSGEVQEGVGLDAVEELPVESSSGKLGSIFILADDDGPEGSRTGAQDWQNILGDIYDITVWSTASDGVPESQDVIGYDAYIIDSGDYAASPEDFETFFAFIDVEEDAGVMFIGAQPLPTSLDEANFEPLKDIEVTDSTHPIAAGFAEGEIILLEPSESGVDSAVIPNPEDLYEDMTVVFSRGPDSPEAGTPVLIAAIDTITNSRIILGTFAFYRLSDEAKELFAVNATAWLMGE